LTDNLYGDTLNVTYPISFFVENEVIPAAIPSLSTAVKGSSIMANDRAEITLELNKRLDASLTESKRLRNENVAVQSTVRHLRRIILDLSLARDGSKDKTGASARGAWMKSKKIYAHTKNQSTQTEPLAKPFHDLEVQRRQSTERSKLNTIWEGCEQLDLKKRLEKANEKVIVLKQQVKNGRVVSRNNELLTNRLSRQDEKMVQMQNELANAHQLHSRLKSLLEEAQEKLITSLQAQEQSHMVLQETQEKLVDSQQAQSQSQPLLEETRENLNTLQRAQMQSQSLLEAEKGKLTISEQGQGESRAVLEETRDRLVLSQQEQTQLQTLLEETLEAPRLAASRNAIPNATG
jgi:hypothetical protein